MRITFLMITFATIYSPVFCDKIDRKYVLNDTIFEINNWNFTFEEQQDGLRKSGTIEGAKNSEEIYFTDTITDNRSMYLLTSLKRLLYINFDQKSCAFIPDIKFESNEVRPTGFIYSGTRDNWSNELKGIELRAIGISVFFSGYILVVPFEFKGE